LLDGGSTWIKQFVLKVRSQGEIKPFLNNI
jgi:hypothetical protein